MVPYRYHIWQTGYCMKISCRKSKAFRPLALVYGFLMKYFTLYAPQSKLSMLFTNL
jgi:hypothetical protein